MRPANLCAASDPPQDQARKKYEMRNRTLTFAALACAGVLLLTGTLRTIRADHDGEKHLFVWAGDQARTNPDFLAVIDFDEHSRNYGSVITTVSFQARPLRATSHITSGFRPTGACWAPVAC